MLDQQPPLQETNEPIIVNFAQAKESPWEKMQALVQVIPYVDEGSSSSLAIAKTQGYEGLPPMHPSQLDVETLLFIAQNNMRSQRTSPMDKKRCFKCSAKDHWYRQCPYDEKQPHFKPVPWFCDGCMVVHLLLHYPRKPANQIQITQDKGKYPLNVVQVIPSGTEDEMVVPI